LVWHASRCAHPGARVITTLQFPPASDIAKWPPEVLLGGLLALALPSAVMLPYRHYRVRAWAELA
jgi:hypothetical protein